MILNQKKTFSAIQWSLDICGFTLFGDGTYLQLAVHLSRKYEQHFLALRAIRKNGVFFGVELHLFNLALFSSLQIEFRKPQKDVT